MITLLSEAEKLLPDLLSQTDIWTSLFVDYHHPYVERLWTQWGENRISLHKIYPCLREEALFHSHPWPQAVKILQGGYEMGIGYGKHSKKPPSLASTLYLPEGTMYEMVDANGWHYVRPINNPSFSIMVTGKPWPIKEESEGKIKLRSLTSQEKDNLLTIFKTFYV